jgi:hypothetical protein
MTLLAMVGHVVTGLADTFEGELIVVDLGLLQANEVWPVLLENGF